jgi:homoserine O-acetyltransferase
MLEVAHTIKHLAQPLALDCGVTLATDIYYNTYGTRATDDSNVVLVLHALTGSADVHDWWSGLVGEGKLLDPAKHFIICPNAIGSCYGSTGPESVDSRTGALYAGTFPEISIRDIARANLALLDELGIAKVALGIGGSMGGMVLLEMAALAPDRFTAIVPIAVAGDHSPWRIAFSATIRKTIVAFDPSLQDRNKLQDGMRVARQFAMTSYRCASEFNTRFARSKSSQVSVESYLEHQGDKIVKRFSPYSYIALTRAMELYDLSANRGTLADVAKRLTARALFIGVSSDILFEDGEIRAFAKLCPDAEYRTLFADHGHDSFLVDTEELVDLIRSFALTALPSSEEVML